MDNEEKKDTQENTQDPRDLKIKELEEKLASLTKETEEEKVKKLIDSKIQELVQLQLKDKESEQEARLREAREIVEKAEQNERIEKELRENELYNRTKSWREAKEREFKREWKKLGSMINMPGNTRSGWFDDISRLGYEGTKDQRTLNKLGIARTIAASGMMDSEHALRVLKRNINYVDFENDV